MNENTSDLSKPPSNCPKCDGETELESAGVARCHFCGHVFKTTKAFKKTKIDILKVLDISTGHVTDGQMNKLIPATKRFVHYENEYGSLIIIPSCVQGGDEGDPAEEALLRGELGNEVVNILKYARNVLGCWAVKFDCDASTYPELFPLFEW